MHICGFSQLLFIIQRKLMLNINLFYLHLSTTQPPIQWVLGAYSPGVKRQQREADH
jgi:hypothetical protein